MQIVVDLGSLTAVTNVAVDVLQIQRSWIFFPKSVGFAVSVDGERWATIFEDRVNPSRESEPVLRRLQTGVDGAPIRYLRIELENLGANPEWHAAPGSRSWLFLDEVVVAKNPS